jgi:chromosome segregation ATPase
MCKKLFVLGLIAAGAFMVYRHYDVKVRPKNDSPEAQIRREREKMSELDGEIRKYISLVAAREVDVKNLDKEIKKLRQEVSQLEQTTVSKTAELKSSGNLVKDSTKNDPERNRAVRELNRIADALARNKAELQAKEEQFDAEKEALDAAHEELVAYQNEKRSLETELAQLDARVAHLRVDEIKNREHFDKSALAQRTSSIKELRNRIEVREKERELRTRYLGTPAQPISTPSEKDVLDKVEKLTGKK